MLPFAPPKNHRIRAFVKSRFVALGRNTPRRHRVTSTRGPAFAAPVRVIDRVHRHTSHSGANSTPAFGTGFAQLAQGMLGVSDLAYSGPAIYVNLAYFTRPQAQLPIVTFTRDELDGCAGAASQLGPFARFQLHAMNQASQWDVTQRQSVPWLDWGIDSGHYLGSRAYILGRDNVASLAIGIQDKGDIGAAIWIVFEPFHLSYNTVISPTKINHAIMPFMCTAAVAYGNTPVVVAPMGLGLLFEQRRIRFAPVQLRTNHLGHTAAARRRWSDFDYGHRTISLNQETPRKSMSNPGFKRT
jgi:hypothetical protein